MVIIGICGDSASGKSHLATMLASQLIDTTILECDRYHSFERNDPHWLQFTQLNPNSNDLDLMQNDIENLKKGNIVWRKSYDHNTGTFTEEHEIKPSSNIIVIGLHTLMYKELYDLAIFMDPDFALKTKWKIERDVNKRGYTYEQVKEQIERRKIDYKTFIEPLKSKADIIINFNINLELLIIIQNRSNLAFQVSDYILKCNTII